MCNILSSQSIFNYSLSIELSTKTVDRKLLIDQSNGKLKVSLKEDCEFYQVERHMIEGLPKIGLIPREFFCSCISRVVDLGHSKKVYFTLPLRGGGSEQSTPSTPSKYVSSLPIKEHDFFEGINSRLYKRKNNSIKKITGTGIDLEYITKGIDKSNLQTAKAYGKDCVLLIGDTGVGKSTLANAIVKGPKSLKLIDIQVQGEFGSYMDATIDTDNPIIEKDGSTVFKIGHGKAKSQTQHPEIFIDNNTAYCDCPGFGDTSGSNRDIVNCVGIKDILDNAKSVRIMIALSALQILDTSGRGQSIRSAVSTLNSIFAEKDFTRYMDSITPVILRCPKGVPVQKLQQSLFESLQNESLSSVAKELARKLVMVDPLERKQCQGELDLSSFKKACTSGTPLKAKNFGNPLTPESMLKINSIFDKTRNNIKDYADKGMFNEAQNQLHILEQLATKKVPLVKNHYFLSNDYLDNKIKEHNIKIKDNHNFEMEKSYQYMCSYANGYGSTNGWTKETVYNKAKTYCDIANIEGPILIIDKDETGAAWSFSDSTKVIKEYSGTQHHVYCGLTKGKWVRFNKDYKWSWYGRTLTKDSNYNGYFVDFK